MAIAFETKREQFTYIARSIQGKYGYLHPVVTPQRLIDSRVADSSLRIFIQRKIERYPTKPTLFEGAIPTISDVVVKKGDSMAIWTDDIPWRIATSGLHKAVREGLVRSDKNRFRLAARENDKFALLPDLFTSAQEQGMPVVVFDNSQKNLSQSAEVADDMHLAVPLILARADMYEGEVYVFDGSSAVLTQVSQMERLREEIGERVAWIVDFNDTVHNKPAYEEGIIDSLSGMIFSS